MRTPSTAERWTRICAGCAKSSAPPRSTWTRSAGSAIASSPEMNRLLGRGCLGAHLSLVGGAVLAWPGAASGGAGARGRRRRADGAGGAGSGRGGPKAAQKQAERTAALFDRMIEGLIVLDAAGAIRHGEPGGAAEACSASTAAPRRPDPAGGRAPSTRWRRSRPRLAAGSQEVLGHELRIEGRGAAAVPAGQRPRAARRRGRPRGRDPGLSRRHAAAPARGRAAGIRRQCEPRAAHAPLAHQERRRNPPRRRQGRPGERASADFLEIIDRHANRLTRS